MNQQLAPVQDEIGVARLKVIGVGGGGSNAVSRMYRDRLPDVDYMIINTDAQAIEASDVPNKLRIGDESAKGMGVGGDPNRGIECAEEDRDEIRELIEGGDMVFIAAGMGGGTGTGAVQTVADIARELGCLTVGVVTRPFHFEGKHRMDQAEEGLRRLKPRVDTLITIPNEALLEIADQALTMEMAFRMADDVLRQGVESIAQLVTVAGEINLDFADVRAIMSNAGQAWMAIGEGSGEKRAAEAAEEALKSPLIDVSLEGAKGVIFNITGGSDLTVNEVHEASDVISTMVDPDANIIFGMVRDDSMEDSVRLTLIATGFHRDLSDVDDEEEIDPESLDIPSFLRTHPNAKRMA
ncbi:MAG: cell division protein FtsZ, partial [Chloroflexota bacterium]